MGWICSTRSSFSLQISSVWHLQVCLSGSFLYSVVHCTVSVKLGDLGEKAETYLHGNPSCVIHSFMGPEKALTFRE